MLWPTPPGEAQPRTNAIAAMMKPVRQRKGACMMPWYQRSGIAPAGLGRRLNPMLIPDMRMKVIPSLDPLIPNSLASWDWAIVAFLEMLRLTVAV